MKKSFLDLVDIPQPCEKSWDEMIGNDVSRLCAYCERSIYNLSEMPAHEAKRLLFQSKGRVCVRLTRETSGKIQTTNPSLHQITRTAKVAAGVLSATLSLANVAFTQNKAIPAKSGKTVYQTQTRKNTSQITFTIFDPRGDFIPEAEVKLTYQKTNREFISKTDEKGVAHFSMLPSGRYEVKASSPGFIDEKRLVVVSEKVEPNIEMTLDVGAAMIGVFIINWYEIPIFNSILQEDFEVVKEYIALKKKVNIQDHDKVSMLHIAAQSGNLDLIKLLIEAGAKINAKDNQGRTPILMIESDNEENFLKIFKLFIAKGADVNTRDKVESGMTLLMKACESDSLKGVKFLLEAGANPNLKDEDGETAMMKTKSEEIKKLLKKYGAKK
jgi:hypothetical protein